MSLGSNNRFAWCGLVCALAAIALLAAVSFAQPTWSELGIRDNSDANQVIDPGGTVRIKAVFTNTADIDLENFGGASAGSIQINYYNAVPADNAQVASASVNVTIVVNPPQDGTTMEATFTLPLEASSYSYLQVRLRPYYYDVNLDEYLFGTRVTSDVIAYTNNPVNNPSAGYWQNLQINQPANEPTLTYPSSSFQSGRDDDTVRVRFSIPYTATANTVLIQFRSGGSAHQEVSFTNTAISEYSCNLRYASNSFTVIAGSNDGGTTLPTINSQTNTTALVNGSQYTFRIQYQRALNVTTYYTDYTTFYYDLTTVGVTWTAPTAGQSITMNGSPDNFTFGWTNAEPYGYQMLQFINASDPNSPHELTLASSFHTTGAKSLVVDLSNLADCADYTYNNTNGSALLVGYTYTCRMTSNDIVANGNVNTNTTFKTTDGITSTPTLTNPAASSSDNNSMAVQYNLPEVAYQGTVLVGFFKNGVNGYVLGTFSGISDTTKAMQKWIMVSEATGTHSGTVTISSGVPATGGGSDGDLGVNVSTYSGAALVDGTYDVRLWYRDSDHNPPAVSAGNNSFTFDTQTQAPTINGEYAAGPSITLNYNQPENASSGTKKITLTRSSGSADAGSPHVLTFTASYLGSGSGLTVSINGSNLGGPAEVDLTSGTNTLVNGTYYTIKLEYQDAIGNSAAYDEYENWMYSTVSNTVTADDPASGVSYVGVNVSNKHIFRFRVRTSSGTTTLNSLTFAIGGTAIPTLQNELANLKVYRNTSGSETTFPGTSTQVGSTILGSALASALTFSSLATTLSTTPLYLYLTISTNSNAWHENFITATINSASDISVASGSVAGSFPLSPSGSTQLPVTLTSLTATSRDGVVYLQWVSETETNNAGYEEMRRFADSENGFESIATYAGANGYPELRSRSFNGTSATPLTYTFADRTVLPGINYEYRLRSYDLDGTMVPLQITASVMVASLPSNFDLQPNYPNPFNSTTQLRFTLPVASRVSLAVYDISGREVARLLSGADKEAGNYAIVWDGASLSSGTYFVRMEAGKFVATRKAVLLK